MNFELIDYDELEPIVSFSIDIIEYFKNDCVVISDFLKGTSPWDKNIMWYLKLSEQELIKNKKEMLTMIIKVYYDIIEKPILEQPDEEPKIANIVDLPFVNLMCSGIDRVQAFFQDERISIIMLRVFFAVIEEKYNLNIDATNYYSSDLGVVINFYEELAKEFDISNNDIPEEEKRNNFEMFSKEVVHHLEEHLNRNFRTKKESLGFIKYFFSVIYAYLKKKEKEGNELVDIDKDIIEYFEDPESDLEYFFCRYFDVRYYLIMSLYDIYLEYGPNFDFRYELKDSKSVNLFSLRDYSFNNKKVPNFIIDDYTLDIRLDKVIAEMMRYSEEEVYNLLIGKEPIYYFLYYVGLDARASEYYKNKIIRKIICDSYSYEKYLSYTNENYKNKIVLDNILDTDEEYIKYFRTYFDQIYSLYKNFINSDDYIKEQIYLYIYKSKQIKEVDKIFDYTMIHYFDIMLGKIRELQSVDCMNYYINSINKGSVDSDRIRIDYTKYGMDNLVRILCLNIYENILLLEDISDKILPSLDIERVKAVIEQVPDITSFTMNNHPFFMKLFELFMLFNKDNITYRNEITKRKTLKKVSSNAILKKLNPYNED